jgi:hypothetical protein
MPAWWDSLQKLSDINTALRAAVAVTTLLSAAIAGGLWRVGARISELQNREGQKTQERIATANNNAEQAILGQKIVEEKLAEASLQTEKVKQENIKLNTKYEEERQARIKIESRLAPRRLSGAQVATFRAHLIGLKNPNVSLFVITGDPEVADFANDIENGLRAAGLTVNVAPGMVFGQAQHGLVLTVGANRLRDAGILAGALKTALNKSEQIPAARAPENSQDLLQITVWPK